MADVSQLLADIERTHSWPGDVDAMKAIQKAAHESDLDLSPLVPELLRRLSGGDEWSMEEAARTLGIIGDASAVPGLCRVLGAGSVELPEDLGSNPGDTVFAYATMANEMDAVHLQVIKALRRIGSKDAIPTLEACTTDPGLADRVRVAAREALKALGGTPTRQ